MITIGNAELHLGDCRHILPTLGKVDLILTDPPYGIKEAAGKNKSRGNLAVSRDYGNLTWDNKIPSPWVFGMLREMSKYQIIFGGNYFPLPATKCYLVWDKDNGKTDFADCELAWTNFNKAVRMLKWRWNGMLQQDMKNKEKRYMPGQKPVAVMQWALGHAPNEVNTVCDPFMGSGTAGIAALRKGKRFIGIEREESYFDIACERITKFNNSLQLWTH